jgi:sporulation protein YlmC with PRC-barrel domain
MLHSGTLTLGTVVLGLPVLMLALRADDSPKKINEAKSIEGVVVRASSVNGMAVKSPNDKELGKVEDVVIDMETGTVRYVAISFGGFLGAGDKLFAVPFRALHVRHEPKSKSPHFELDISKETLEKAKGFDKKHWPDFANPRFAEENDRYFVEVQARKEKK